MKMPLKGLAALVVLSSAFVALVLSSLLVSNHDSNVSTLYCTPSTAPSSIETLNFASNNLQKVAKCFRVKDGLFTEILYSQDEVEDDEIITYIDGFVLPGIIESHGHILQYGEMLQSVSLYGAESVGEIRTRIKSFLKAHEGEGYGTPEKWVRGIGWDQAYFGGVMPTAVCSQSMVFSTEEY